MRRGDRAVLWVSGDGRTMGRGVWGLGWVTGPADELAGPTGGRRRREVPLQVPLLRAGVSPEEIRAAGVADLEVLVQPHGSNPSWMSTEQLSALAELLGEWPAAG
jgi:hypothetical protein